MPSQSANELSKLQWLISVYRHVYQWYVARGNDDPATFLAKMRALEARSTEYRERAAQLAAD